MMANAEPIAVRLQKISTEPTPETATRGTARGKRQSQRRATLPGTPLAGRKLGETFREPLARNHRVRNPTRWALRRRDYVKLVFVHADGMPEDG